MTYFSHHKIEEQPSKNIESLVCYSYQNSKRVLEGAMLLKMVWVINICSRVQDSTLKPKKDAFFN